MRIRFKVIAAIAAAGVLLPGGLGRAEEIGVAPATSVGERPSGDEYRIGPTDVVEVNVWQNDEMNQTLTVRHDGKVTYKLLGDILAAGRTPAELDAEITERLREFIRNPQVTVRIVEANSRKVLVLGAVQKPGPYLLRGSPRVLEVLTDVGWREDQADITNVTVLRESGDVLRVNLQALLYQGDLAQNIPVRPDDTIFLPPKAGVPGTTAIAEEVRVMALGEVGRAGVLAFPAGEPVTVKTLLLQAGGVTQRAALGRAKVIRADNRQEPVDLNRLLFDGDMTQDLALAPGDVFYVPQARRTRIFVLGMVRTPGMIESDQERLSVMQAIVLANHEREGAVLSNVKVVRDWPNDPKVITVNLERLLRQGDVSQNVPLREGDVVFVPRAFGDVALETYRRILAPIFPTAAAVGTVRAIEQGQATSLTQTGLAF